jgi:hypothetical protein
MFENGRSWLVALVAGLGLPLAAQADEQPHMRMAHLDLKLAKLSLESAKSNKAGHRVKAITIIEEALKEVHEGIVFDNTHNGAAEDKKEDQDAQDRLAKIPKDEHQHWMKAADQALNDARTELQAATEDKGGHRVKALELIKAAQDEIAQGMKAAADEKAAPTP